MQKSFMLMNQVLKNIILVFTVMHLVVSVFMGKFREHALAERALLVQSIKITTSLRDLRLKAI